MPNNRQAATTVTVRRGLPNDADAIFRIAQSLLGWFTPRGAEMIRLDLNTHTALVAMEAADIVGFLTYFTYEGIGRIGWLGVRPDHHRHGIGRALVTAFEQEMRTIGIDKVEVYTLGDGVEYEPYVRTRNFYRAVGFRDHRIIKRDNPSCPEELVLRKHLGEAHHAAWPEPLVIDASSGIQVVPAKLGDLSIAENLSSLYIHDMSELMGWRCPETGRFGGADEFFEDWRAGRNRPYLIRVGKELAGFTGLREVDDAHGHQWDIPEFFILRKFRRRGVGSHVAVHLFDGHRGNWRVAQLMGNTRAVAFWRAIIGDYTGGKFTETREPSPWGEMNYIRFNNAAST